MNFSTLNGRLFDIDTKDYTFDKLANLKDKKSYVINGFWINNSKFGKQVVLICNELKKLINLPSYLVQTFEGLQVNNEAIEQIKNGKVAFSRKEYEKNGKKYYTINFIDL